MSGNRTSVFIVEDDEMFLKSVQHNLAQNRSLDIRVFSDGESAIKAFDTAAKKPHVVILDYFLSTDNTSKKSGLDVLKHIKSEKKIAKKVEVIILSGQEDVEVAVNSVEAGAYDYVVKNRSAFLRVQNDIKRIAALRAKKQENKKLRTFIIFLSILLAVLAFVSLIFTIDTTFFGLLG